MQAFSLRLTSANPVRGVARFALTLPESRHAEVGVYDLRGSLVKRLVTGELPAGSSEVSWDGSDASGRPMGAGVYFVRAVDGEHAVSARVVIAR